MTGASSARRTVSSEELAAPLLAYGEAVEWVRNHFTSLPARQTALADCLGLVLAEDLVADDDIPNFDNSAMDGYAVRSSDGGEGMGSFVVGDQIAEGVAVKVMTGQPIPEGADAVVPWEDAVVGGDSRVSVAMPISPGQFVRRRGSDVPEGTRVLTSGATIGPIEIGMAAALGCSELFVVPRPKVGILSTGDELVAVGDVLGRGRVRDSNGPMLVATAIRLGAEVTGTAVAADDPTAISEALQRLAQKADVVVSSGGASVGERDWLRSILEQEGELALWRVAMRPGKPVAIGRIAGASVIVLPGNPGAVAACSHVVLGRAIRSLAGASADPVAVTGVLAEPIEGDAVRTVIHPVTMVGTAVHPAQGKSSQSLSNAIGIDGWVIVPPGGLTAGVTVDVEAMP